MNNSTTFALRPCYLCDKLVPSKVHDYGRMFYFECPDCGEYQISNMAMGGLQDSKQSLKKTVKDSQKSNNDSEIITITTSSVKNDQRRQADGA